MKKQAVVLLAVITGLCLGVPARAADGEKSVKELVKDARSGNFEHFQRRFVGRARGSFGTMENFNLIRNRTQDYKKLQTREALVNSEHGFRIYTVDVYATKPRSKQVSGSQYVITATTQCAVSQNYEPGFCWGPGYGAGYWGGWYDGCDAGHYYESERCSVTELTDTQGR